MKRTACVVAILAMVSACNEKKKSRRSSDDEEETGGCRLAKDAPASAFAAGKSAGMVNPFTALKLGMSPKDAMAACPNLFKGDSATKTGTFSVGEIIGKFGDGYAHGRLSFSADKLTSVEITGPTAMADALTSAWGAPQKSGGKPALAWFDEATHTRAMLAPDERGSRELKISSYVATKDLLDPESKVVTLHPQDVLGKTPAELAKQFPQYAGASTTSESTKKTTAKMMEGMKKDLEAKGVTITEHDDSVEVRLPAAPYAGDATTHVILYQNDDGTIRSYGIWFHTEELMSGAHWPQQRDEVLKQMDALWGPHKIIKETLGEQHTWYDAKRGIRVTARVDPAKPGETNIDFSRYLPLAELFGAPGPVWGFEKGTALIGQTAEALAAAYGKVYVAKPGEDLATLHLPPTDYDGVTSRTSILMFLEGGKVREWRFNIPFDDYEPAQAEYKALLEAKFGPGKPARDEHVIYGKSPKVDAEFTKITHALDVEVTK